MLLNIFVYLQGPPKNTVTIMERKCDIKYLFTCTQSGTVTDVGFRVGFKLKPCAVTWDLNVITLPVGDRNTSYSSSVATPWSLLEKLFTAKKWRLGIEKYYELVKYRTKRVIIL